MYEKSFQITFLNLVCITILLYFRSLNSNLTDKHKLSLQLAAMVTSIASFHYYYMINDINRPVIYRYFDWFFTTPILLIDLCIMYDIYDYNLFTQILILNTTMLIFGFLGECKILPILPSTILGFIPFIILFYQIRKNINNTNKNIDYKLFNTFIILWSLYGINHMFPDEKIKNINYNVLDFITKGLFGLYIYGKSYHKN